VLIHYLYIMFSKYTYHIYTQGVLFSINHYDIHIHTHMRAHHPIFIYNKSRPVIDEYRAVCANTCVCVCVCVCISWWLILNNTHCVFTHLRILYTLHQYIVHQNIVHQYIVHQYIVHQYIVHQYITLLFSFCLQILKQFSTHIEHHWYGEVRWYKIHHHHQYNIY